MRKLKITKLTAVMLVLSMIFASFAYAGQETAKAMALTLPGDVNGDGKVSIKDTQIALRASLGIISLTKDELKRANVNNKEGILSNADINLPLVQKILRIALGITISTPWPAESSETPTSEIPTSEIPTSEQPISSDIPESTEEPSQLEKWGLGKEETEYVSLNRDYDWYVDQADTGFVNCGPPCAEMAGRWSNGKFSKTATDAMSFYWLKDDGVCYPHLIREFLSDNGIPCQLVDQQLTEQEVKEYINNNQILVVAYRTGMIFANYQLEERVGRFYSVDSEHFSIIKGYRVVDGISYFEMYDPECYGSVYKDGSLKGINRYYLSSDLIDAMNRMKLPYIAISETMN